MTGLRSRCGPGIGILSALCLLTLVVSPAVAAPGDLMPAFPSVGGEVMAAVESDGVLYLAGSFNIVGRATGGWAGIDLAAGLADTSWPTVEGAVYAMCPDGAGGWYIGGSFTAVGDVARRRLAHIRSDKTLDPDWDPQADDTVWTIATSPDHSTVYVGGSFATIGSSTIRNRIAAIDAATGEVSAWDPNANWHVYAITTASDGTVYVGGYFDTIGGQPRARIAALDPTTGNATAWDPACTVVGATYVRAVALSQDENTVYIGGLFQMVGGQVRQRIAAINAADAGVTNWDPATGGNTPVIYSMVVSGQTVYAAGSFTQIGGQNRNNIAALDATTGLATAWDPNCDSTVYSIALNGTTVYAGGAFLNVGNQPRWHLAGIGASGSATDWAPSADQDVHAIAVANDELYAGGNFLLVGAMRNNLAAVDTATNQVTSWNPDVDPYGWVTDMELAEDGATLYVGGYFETVGGQTRYNVAEVNVATGAVTDWDPSITGGGGFGFTPPVYALAVHNGLVYVGGDFTDVGNDSRAGMTAIDAATGLATNWAPSPDGTVYDIEIEGGLLYVAGTFISIAGADRTGVAAFCVTDHSLNDWDAHANDSILDLSATSQAVYLAGSFTTVGGQLRAGLAAVDAAGGAVRDWDPDPSDEVTVVKADAGAVYVGGTFLQMGGSDHTRLALLDPVTGAACPGWGVDLDERVNSMARVGDRLLVSGYFQHLNGSYRPGFAVFVTHSGPTASGDEISVEAGSAVSGTLPSSVGSGTLAFAVVDQPSAGTVDITNPETGAYTYAANADASGTDSFTYRVGDDCLASELATVTVTISTPDQPPVDDNGPPPLVTYSLTTSVSPSDAGTIVAAPQAAAYAAGTRVTLTANAAEGYRFVMWEGDATGLAASTSLVVDANKSVQAVFTPAETSVASVVTTDAPTTVSLSDTATGSQVADLNFTSASQQGKVVMNINQPGEAHNGVFVGFAGGLGISRSISIHSDLPAGSFVVLIELSYSDAEVVGLDEAQLRLFRWNDDEQQWKLAATTDRGVSEPTSQLGDYGVDTANNRVWAVVDHFSEFGIGAAASQTAPGDATDDATDEPANNSTDDPGDDETLSDPAELPLPCGACGSGVPFMSALGFIALALLRRTR